MKDLFNNWKNVSAKIKKSAFILLLLDFDGTLCPIVSHPDLVKVDKNILSLLDKLNKKQYNPITNPAKIGISILDSMIL